MFFFICESCGKQRNLKEKPENFSKVCRYCKSKETYRQTCLQKYGVENVSQLQRIKVKKKKTFLEKYGVSHNSQIEAVKLKKEQTYLQHYGVTNPSQSATIKEKKERTCLKHFGTKSSNTAESVKEKKKNTFLKKYNVRNPQQSEIIRTKTEQTCLKKYGTRCTTQAEVVKRKIRETKLKRYQDPFYTNREKCRETTKKHFGVDYYAQSLEAQQNRRSVYTYNNQKFDSKTELCFYIYNSDKGRNIKRNTQSFEYIFENKKHYYFPDFEIDGKFYEIKGNQFLKEDGSWQNPFDHKQDDFYETKHQCALQNNVIILYSKDCKDYIKYVEEKYGKSYFES